MQAVERQHRVLVTGMGVVSPLGSDLSSNLKSLLDARDAVAPVKTFDVTKTRCKTAAQIPDGWLEDALARRRSSHRSHRGARMAGMALREACDSAKGPTPELIVVGTTSGGMSFGEDYYRRLLVTKSRKGRRPSGGKLYASEIDPRRT